MKNESQVAEKQQLKNDSYDLRLSEHKKQQLKKRFDERSYCMQNRWLRSLCSAFSITKHAASITLGFLGAWYFLASITHWLAAGLLAALALAMIEIAQRKSSDGFWDKFFQSHKTQISWGLMGLSLLCVACNGIITGYGYYETTIRNADNAPIITNDSTLLALNSQLFQVDQEIQNSRSTKWRGTTTVDAQRAIKEYSKTKGELTTAILEREATLQAKNEHIEFDHQTHIEQIAFIALLLCLLVELLFECSMSYSSYYDHRLYIELGLDQHGNTDQNEEEENFIGSTLNVSIPTYESNKAILNKNEVGFSAIRDRREPSEPSVRHPIEIKTPKTTRECVKIKMNQAKPVGVQVSHNEPRQVRQVRQDRIKEIQSNEKETVIVVERNERQMRNQLSKSFKRKNIQLDPTTPQKRFEEAKKQLEKWGYQIQEEGKGEGAVLSYTWENKNRSIVITKEMLK